MAIIREDEVNVEEYKKVRFFKKVKEILEEEDIEYWIALGALLGYVREKRFIPWDHDIDIATLDISKVEKLESEFKKRNLTMTIKYRDLKYETTTIQIRDAALPKKTKFHIDIYEFDLKNGNTVWKHMVRNNMISKVANVTYNSLKGSYLSKDIGKYKKGKKTLVKFTNKLPLFIRPPMLKLLKEIDIKFSDKLFLVFPNKGTQIVDFYGMKVKIPVNSEEHLKIAYGKKWRIPDKEFKHDGNV